MQRGPTRSSTQVKIMIKSSFHKNLSATISYKITTTQNSELHDELPALHDSRILFLVTNMQTLFAAEEVFHSETAKVTATSQTVDHVVQSFAAKESFSVSAKREMSWKGRGFSPSMTC